MKGTVLARPGVQTLHRENPLPEELLEDFQSGNVRLIAHNASFERVCFSVHLQRHLPGQYLKPGEFLSPDSWICTMVMAASLTLPMALKDVGTCAEDQPAER